MRFVINKMNQEIRSAKAVSGQTIFNKDQGRLVLRQEGRFNRTVFTLSNGVISIEQSGEGRDLSGSLTTSDVEATVMRIRDLRVNEQDAVQVSLQINYRNPQPGIGLDSNLSSNFSVIVRDIGQDEEDVAFEAMTPPIDRAVILMYHFDETDNLVKDSSDYKHHGTPKKLERDEEGKFLKSARFTGNSEVDAGNSDALTKLDSFTIEAWIKPDKLGHSMAILSKEKNCRWCGGYKLQTSYSSISFVYINPDTGWRETLAADGLATGVWQHVAASFDQDTRELKVFINGVERNSKALTKTPHQNQAHDINLYIGSDSGRWDYFEGQIDEVRISNIARTDFILAHDDGVANIANTSINAGENLQITISDEDLDKLPGPGRKLKDSISELETDDFASILVISSRGDKESLKIQESDTPGDFLGKIGTIFSGEPQQENGKLEVLVEDTLTLIYNDELDVLARSNVKREDRVLVVANSNTLDPRCTFDDYTIALYHMDNNAGEVIDATGKGNNGHAFDVTRAQSGHTHGFFKFDNYAHIKIPPIPELSNSGSFTVEAWIRPDTALKHDMTIATNAGYRQGDGGFRFYTSYGALAFYVINPSSGYGKSISAGGLKPDVWQHVAASFNDSTETANLYINGQLVKSQKLGHKANRTNNVVYIGTHLNRWSYFDGDIDEARFSKKAHESFCLLPISAEMFTTPDQNLEIGKKLEITVRDTDRDLHPGYKNDEVSVRIVVGDGGDSERLVLVESKTPGEFTGSIYTELRSDHVLQDAKLQIPNDTTIEISFQDPTDYDNQPRIIKKNVNAIK